MGKCCTGKTLQNVECDGVCRPRFRVCLKEYQVKIDTTSPCTFGDVITSELGPNPVTDTPQTGFSNSIAFPFPFTWPVSIKIKSTSNSKAQPTNSLIPSIKISVTDQNLNEYRKTLQLFHEEPVKVCQEKILFDPSTKT